LRNLNVTTQIAISGAAGATFNRLRCDNTRLGNGVSTAGYTGNAGSLQLFFGGSDFAQGGASGYGTINSVVQGNIGGGTDEDDTLVFALNTYFDGNIDAQMIGARGCQFNGGTFVGKTGNTSYLYDCETRSAASFTWPGSTACHIDQFTNYYLKASGTHTNISKTIVEDATP
jgi:hypothetical protein